MRRLTSLLVLCLAATLAAPVFAQAPDADDPWETGRQYYRERNYVEAARYIVEAIHREPDNARYYLGLARTHYLRGDADTAVYFYDIYLVDLADRIGTDVRPEDRVDRVRSERDSANATREDPEAPIGPPPAAAAAVAALESRIAAGPMMTTTGGGAYALYQGVLRSGYAHPDLTSIRGRLARGLLAEASGVVSDHEAAIPPLSLVQWQAQLARFEAWQSLVPAPEIGAPTTPATDIPDTALDARAVGVDPWTRVNAHMSLCSAQVFYLNQNFAQAADAFGEALRAMPSLVPARMGRLNALYRMGNAADSVDAELDALAATLRENAPAQAHVVAVYRAAFAAQRGDAEGAAAALTEMIAR